MTNEEIVEAIQSGHADLMGDLLIKNTGLIAHVSRGYMTHIDPAIDIEDIKQNAAIGMIEAVPGYDPTQGMNFASYARLYMRKCIRELMGIRTSKIRIENTRPARLDEPIGEDMETTRGAMLADPNAIDPHESAEISDMQSITRAVVAELPNTERQVIEGYLQPGSPTLPQISAGIGITMLQAQAAKERATRALRRDKRLRRLMAEYQSATHIHVGVMAFKTTWTSSVELAVEIRARVMERIAGRG